MIHSRIVILLLHWDIEFQNQTPGFSTIYHRYLDVIS